MEIVGRKWLSKPESYIGCSALEDEGLHVKYQLFLPDLNEA